jgi:hypothetical protein
MARKTWETRYADFKHRMSQAFPATQPYHPTGKQMLSERAKAWREFMRRKRKRFLDKLEQQD